MTVLCSTCHDKFHKKFLSKKAIENAMKTPYAFRHGYSHEKIDIGTQLPNIIVGDSFFWQCNCPIIVSGHPIVAFRNPEYKGGPYRLSANFYDQDGMKTL